MPGTARRAWLLLPSGRPTPSPHRARFLSPRSQFSRSRYALATSRCAAPHRVTFKSCSCDLQAATRHHRRQHQSSNNSAHTCDRATGCGAAAQGEQTGTLPAGLHACVAYPCSDKPPSTPEPLLSPLTSNGRLSAPPGHPQRALPCSGHAQTPDPTPNHTSEHHSPTNM